VKEVFLYCCRETPLSDVARSGVSSLDKPIWERGGGVVSKIDGFMIHFDPEDISKSKK
jgi:hypothetical protein